MKKSQTNLIDALFPKVRQQVLGLLFVSPDASFYTNEIIRLTNSGTGAIQRELEKLAHSGIVKVQIVGRQKRYQANKNSPLFCELQAIFLKTSGLADIIKRALEPVYERIYFAFIYGSIARQEDTASSDIDLLLISDNLTYSEIFPLLESCQTKLGREIHPTFYTAKEWALKRKKEHHFILNLLKRPKIFLIGTEDELKQLR